MQSYPSNAAAKTQARDKHKHKNPARRNSRSRRLFFRQTRSFRAAKCFTHAERDLHGGAAAASRAEGPLHCAALGAARSSVHFS